MPMPLWWGRINKKLFNPGALERGSWPVLRHVGRASGREYRTPLGAHRTDTGFVFVVVYGPETDWLQNVLAAGSAALEIEGEVLSLTAPRLVTVDEAFAKLPAGVKRPPRLLAITQCLEMELVGEQVEPAMG